MLIPTPFFPWMYLPTHGIIKVIIDWAKGVFNRLSETVKKAWVYVKRVPGAVKQMVRYIKNGTIYEESTTTEVSLDQLKMQLDRGELTKDEYNVLISEYEQKLAEITRPETVMLFNNKLLII